ncbi:MAG: glycosyltransferase family 4 protein [Sphingobacteriaceae bacterium]|nr:glycosyltransferase family 4 protein [Sphingobacteriaceae bacterium]
MNKPTLVIDALSQKKNKAFGFQEYLFNLLNDLYNYSDRLNYSKVLIVCDFSEIDSFSRFSDKFEILGFKVFNLPHRLFLQTYLPFKLKLNKQDVVLNLVNYSGLWKRSKNILVIHDLLYLRKELLKNKLMRLQRLIWVGRSIALADTIVAISDYTKNDILRNFKVSKSQKVLRIYNYFNFEKFGNEYVNSEINSEHYFLAVSSAAYHKNSVTILRAFEKFCQLNSNVKMVFVGSINEENANLFYQKMPDNIKQRIEIKSNVSNQELSLLYKNCKAYISASFFEGLGMPVVEAMYFNATLLLSDIEVFREITNGEAIFFNQNSSNSLCEAMLKSNETCIESRQQILDKFSSINTSLKYIDALNNV